jgi:thioesterase domain-containing protein
MSQPSREANVEELARQLAMDIQLLQPEGPCYLGGECIGGIVAFEAARQLQAMGRKIGLLALMDTVCPHRTSILRYRLANVNHGVLGRISWYRNDLGQLKVRHWGPYMLDKSRKAWTRATRGWRSGSEEPAKELDHGLGLRADSDSYAKTLLQYKPQPFEGLVTLLISDDLYPRNRVQPWAEFATKGIELHVVPGNHETYIREHSTALAECLRACLHKAQA